MTTQLQLINIIIKYATVGLRKSFKFSVSSACVSLVMLCRVTVCLGLIPQIAHQH